MANITIAGNSYVIASDIAMADLETVRKYRPSALALVDDESKETIFKVGIGSNSLSEHGVSFGGVSNCEGKAATATLPIPDGTKDAKVYIIDTAGTALVNLRKIEAGIAGVLDEIKSEHESIAESITVSV